MLPLTVAAFVAHPSEASAQAPPWPPFGDLATGSSGTATGFDPVGAFPGGGSSGGPAVSSGSAAEGDTSGGSLSLGPIRLPSGSAGLTPSGSGGASGPLATGDAESGVTHPVDTTPRPDVTAEHPTAAPGVDAGSAQLACTGSAVTGSALLLLGLVTGSGFGSLVPGLIGPGSSGSGLGSAAVGSAATGSAVLTCLLLLPTTPPEPMSPLQLGPPAPVLPIVPAPAAVPVPVLPRADRPLPESPPRPQNRQRGRDIQAVEPAHDPDAWSLMKLMTVLVVTVITVVGIRLSPGSKRPR
ncbi:MULTISPECIES: hypothetical protein [Nocardia]|uniref:Uncharacterized protein n=1 Tax=Nocardia implantans TaxID=3108168 RepID=A0ABU6AXC2_9NOCA|nr:MULTISPECIES: hypothetical protein [unclassified Nocardia]MBF6193716.1 hypothetical protein [Nocardia beijingensis]MEA3529546.1 hypothetical protein [Nocardia sp. CDC192]MEB3512132.1 hypothetical protein [Nocardia sp. CDC186]